MEARRGRADPVLTGRECEATSASRCFVDRGLRCSRSVPTPNVSWGDRVRHVGPLWSVRAPGLYGSTSFQLPCDGRPRGVLPISLTVPVLACRRALALPSAYFGARFRCTVTSPRIWPNRWRPACKASCVCATVPQPLRPSFDLHPLVDWIDDPRALVAFLQEAHPEHAGPPLRSLGLASPRDRLFHPGHSVPAFPLEAAKCEDGQL